MNALGLFLFALILFPMPSFAMPEDFGAPDSLDSWTALHDTEGYANDLEFMGVSSSGALQMMPYSTTWFNDYKGPLLYRTLQGDFSFTAEVSVSNRAQTNFPGSDYSLAGLMVRVPQPQTTSMDTWQPGQENYLFLSIGRAGYVDWLPDGVRAPHLEVKSTVNSQSNLEITQINAVAPVKLRMIRRGAEFTCLYQIAEQPWQIVRRYVREDMPNELQVGLVAYTDYRKVSTYSAFDQLSNILSDQLVDISSREPERPFNPDLLANFHSIESASFTLPEDIPSFAEMSDSQLLAILNDIDNAAESDPASSPGDSGNVDTSFGEETSVDTCLPPWPITQSSRLTAIGNSFIGNDGGICNHFSALQMSADLPFFVESQCDIRYGAYLREMFDDQWEGAPLNVVADAQSGNYDYALFISDILGDNLDDASGERGMVAFDQLYDQNCMQSIVFMTWNWLNPVGSLVEDLTDYRSQILALAQRMRVMELEHGAKVIPYGVVLHNLTVAPPVALSHLPIDYLYQPNGNIHDNALGMWLKANTLYASLFNLSPEGVQYSSSPIQGATIIGLPEINLNESLQLELQERIWQIVQDWNNGVALETLIATPDTAQTNAIGTVPSIDLFTLTVNQGNGSGHYVEGETVVISAIATHYGEQFSHWEGDIETVDDPQAATTQLLMTDSNRQLTAVFMDPISPIGSGSGHVHYVRIQLTEFASNNQWHLSELEWLDENDQLLTDVSERSFHIDTSYPTNFVERVLDGDIQTNYYMSVQPGNGVNLPINITVSFDLPVFPHALRIRYPMWSPNLSGFRILTSSDGDQWSQEFEYQGNINDFLIDSGAINTALVHF